MKYSATAFVLSAALVAGALAMPPAAFADAAAPAEFSQTEIQGSHRFTWAATAGATAYRLEIANDPGFGVVLEAADTYSRTYASRIALKSSSARTVYWRVASYSDGVKAASRSAWSATQILELDAADAVTPLTPTADATIAYPAPVQFTWSPSPTAVSYDVQYAPGGDFANSATTVTAENLTGTGHTPAAPLAKGTYEWRVRAKLFNTKEALYTPWSASVAFTVDWRVANARVVQTSPAEYIGSDRKAVSDPLFSWQPVAGASYYTLRIARNADMTNPVELSRTGTDAEKTRALVYGTTFVPDRTLPNGDYFWTVTAHDLAGNAGASSEPRRFFQQWGMQPEALQPGTGVLARPVTHQGTTDESAPEPIPFNQFILSWDPVPRATLYAVELSPIIEASESSNPAGAKPSVLHCRTANTSATALNWFDTGNMTGVFDGVGTCFNFPLKATDLDKYLYVVNGSGVPVSDGDGNRIPRQYSYQVTAVNYSGADTTAVQSDTPANTLVSNPSTQKYISMAENVSRDTGVIVDLDEEAFAQQWASPTDNTIGLPAPVLRWSPVADAAGYEVHVYRASVPDDITNHIATFRTHSTVFQPNGVFLEDDVSHDTAYRYKVRPLARANTWAGALHIGTTTWDSTSLESVFWKRTTAAAVVPEDYSSAQNGSVLLTWTPQFEVASDEGGSRGYQVRYRFVDSGAAWTDVKVEYPSWVPKKTDGSPLPNGGYEFQVAALDANGLPGRYSTTKTFTIEPTKPTGLAVSRAGSGVRLTWNASDVSEGYQVRYRQGSQDWTKLPASDSATPLRQTAVVVPLTSSPLIDSGTVEFQVRSRGKGGHWSQWSSSAATPITRTAVTPTTASGAVLSTGDRVLTWNPVPGASRYLVQVASTQAGVATAPLVETVGTSFTPEKAIDHGVTHYWRVIAVSEYSGSAAASLTKRFVLGESPIRSFYVDTPPKTPVIKTAALTGVDQAELRWDVPTAAAAGVDDGVTYVVRYRKSDQTPADSWVEKSVSGTDATAFTVTKLALATNYEFQLSARNSEGVSAWSAVKKVQTLTTPASVRSLKATKVTGSTIALSWQAPTGNSGLQAVTNYRVRYATLSGAWKTVDTGTKLSVTLSGLTANAAYKIEVVGRNAAGDGSVAALQVTTSALPQAPGGLKATQSGNGVKLTWKAPSGTAAKKYAVQYRVKSGSTWGAWTPQRETASTSTTHTGLKYKSTYQYRVAAISDAGTGAFSAAVTVTVKPPLPTQPKVTLKAQKGKTTVTWVKATSASTPVTGYKILWSTNGKTWKTLKSVTAKTTSYATTKGTKGKYLYIKVAAKNTYGYGSYSSVKKIKRK